MIRKKKKLTKVVSDTIIKETKKYKSMAIKKELIINKDGFRKDLDDYFLKYMLTYRIQISQFTVVVPSTNRVFCRRHTKSLFELPDDATVFHAWPGKYRSDVFVFTVKQMKEWVEEQDVKVLRKLTVYQSLKE